MHGRHTPLRPSLSLSSGANSSTSFSRSHRVHRFAPPGTPLASASRNPTHFARAAILALMQPRQYRDSPSAACLSLLNAPVGSVASHRGHGFSLIASTSPPFLVRDTPRVRLDSLLVL